MTLGLQMIKFILEQHEDNVPIVQVWLDKWFWRGYRLLGLVGTMMDYMLPKKVMSWQKAWEIYWEENGVALFHDLARYGIRMPKYHEVATKEKGRLTHEFWSTIYQNSCVRDRAWYLSIPKSYFEDAMTAGPFEFVTAIGFSFEYVLTNLLFMPFVSGAAYNGDMATTTFGFSAQSDESRHMTLGLELVKFLLEQHEDNVPIVQACLDKWFWRGYRLLGLVGTMMDYMLPTRASSR